MDDRLVRQTLDHTDFLGLEYSPLYLCKSKRGMKREETKDAYKLPHRLIEKKRRDRINECIGQLKDLLPEHLKLTTLGHLEKAVVLELTLKHLNTLTAVTEQQHQKILALQSGDRSTKSSIQADLESFHSGFQTCAKEVLQYLRRAEKWGAREPRCVQLAGHLQKVCEQLLPGAPLLPLQLFSATGSPPSQESGGQNAEPQTNCVPVIQRTQNGELNEHDTDTDSGYGGEVEKHDNKSERECDGTKEDGPPEVRIKQETEDEPRAKRVRLDCGAKVDPPSRSNVAVLNSLVGLGSAPFGPTSFCMPFYFLNPSAATSYTPLMDKSSVDKYVLSATAAVGAPFPLLYPGFPAVFSGASPPLGPGSSLWPGYAADIPDEADLESPMENGSMDMEDCGDEPQEAGNGGD
ncbi:class E basic helix-loop-helix protein 41-like [Arapaima gigas]